MNPLPEKGKSYEKILQDVLDLYYLGCRIEYNRNSVREDAAKLLDIILGDVEEEIAHEFKHPIEKLMWHCVILILGLGFNEQSEKYHREQATAIIHNIGVDIIMKHIDINEAVEFDADLRKLCLLG